MAGRRNNGEGSITQRKDGRWQASVRLKGTRHTVYGKTEREARKKLRALQVEIASTGASLSPARYTVDELVSAWLASASNLKPSTTAQYRKFYDTYARSILGQMRLATITPDLIQRLYSKLTPSVAAHVHAVLHRAFVIAVRWEWMPANPCERVLKPAHKPARKALWTQAELDNFLAGTQNHWLSPLWWLLIATGMRLGEALALRWDDLNAEGATLAISRTLHRINREWVITAPKSAAGMRTITLPPVAIEALAVQRQRQDAWRDAAGERWEDTALIFTGETGSPVHHSTVAHAMQRECVRLKLPAVTPHGLRHLHASLLIHSGVPITAVSARLGHATPQVTMTIYAHALSGQDARAAQAISEALAPTARESKLEEG